MKLCILCGKNPPIENSHVISKFVIRWIKDGTPHGTLRFSNDLKRPHQDGWKSDYLCSDCEQKFGRWENWFSREIFRPYLDGTRQTFCVTEKVSLFAASIHYRCLHHAFELHPNKVPVPAVRKMYDMLRTVCLTEVLPQSGFNAYLEFVPEISAPDPLWPPGVNAYLRESVDRELFPLKTSAGFESWISYVKLPSIILLISEHDLSSALPVPRFFDNVTIPRNGNMDAQTQLKFLLVMMRETVVRRAHQIQAGYKEIPKRQMESMMNRIQTHPRKESFRAHKTYLADQALMSDNGAPPESATEARGAKE